MMKTKIILVNFFPNRLVSELLDRNYIVTKVSTWVDQRLLSSMDLSKFDLVYFAKSYPPIWDDLDILLHYPTTPVIYAFHSPSIMFHPYRPKNHILNLISLMKIIYMRMTPSIAAFHTLNTFEYELLSSFGCKCYYTPLGVDTNLFKLRWKDDRFTIVFVGPRYGKGADMLGRILPEVVRKAPDVKFVLVGTGFLNHYFESLRRIFRNNVEVHGVLGQKEFAELLSTSHVLLFPSRFETFGLVAIEALSSGMPVLCFDIAGAPRDIVKKYNAGFVAHAFKIEMIISGTLGYYEMWKNQKEEFSRVSLACRNVALKFDWSNVAGLFERMLRETLDESKARELSSASRI